MRRPTRHQTPKEIGLLVELTHHRWSIPIVVELYRLRGAKFVTLHKRLGVGRDSLSRTLKALQQQGLVMRNPGYGHPMRPEYILTPEGASLAPPLANLLARLQPSIVKADVLAKWTLPALVALRHGPRRFTDMRFDLSPVSPRALSHVLAGLVESGLAESDSGRYRLTGDGWRLFRPRIPRPAAGPACPPFVGSSADAAGS